MATVLIVGGGVIGCAIAERLVRDRHQVTLVDRDRLGAQASSGAAGLLAPHSEDEFAVGGSFAAELAQRSYALYPDLVARLETGSGLRLEFALQESLRLAFTPAEVASLRERARADAAGRWLEREDLLVLEPEVGPGVRGAILFAEARIAPRRLVSALARVAARGGAQLREGTPATGLLVGGDRVQGVQVPGAVLAADWVILAAGPWTSEIASTAGLEAMVSPRRGQLVTLIPTVEVVRRILTVDGLYVVPRPDGTVVVGGTEEAAGFDARTTVEGVSELLDFARRSLPALASAEVGGVWAGLRPVSPGGLPVIGPAPGYSNLVLATGHRRNGILLAPITAEIVAQGLAGSWPQPQLAAPISAIET